MTDADPVEVDSEAGRSSADLDGPRGRFSRARDVLRAILYEVRAENVTFMAGSIAYHAFVSLLPLIVLLLFVVASVGDAGLTERVYALVETVLTPTGRTLVTDAVEGGIQVTGTSVLGLAVLLWATLRIFRGLDQAFSDIYETERANPLLDQIADGLVVLLSVAGAVVIATVVRSVLDFGPGVTGILAGAAFVVAGLTIALFPIYYMFPDLDLRPVEVLPGTVFAALGVTLLESAFRLYVEFSSTSQTYGVLGAILVIVTWLYFNGLVVLLGAVINAVLTNRTEDVDIAPVFGDWRPGIGRTIGPAGNSEERTLVARRLRTVADRVSETDSLRVLVGDDRIRLPKPREVTLDADPEDENGVGIELRW